MFLLHVGLALAASFTSSFDDFPYYQGNRDHLQSILHIFGTCSLQFDRTASTLDELLSNELIISFVSPFRFEKLDLFKLGMLLSDLSPSRFDDLCTSLDSEYFEVIDLVRGYPLLDSAWKSELCHAGQEMCEYWTSNPMRVISRKQVADCLDYWCGVGDYEMVRQLAQHDLWFRYKCPRHHEAFRGHEASYVQLLCEKIRNGMVMTVFLPEFIMAEHLQPLIELSQSNKWPYHAKLHSNSHDRSFLELIKVTNAAIERRDVALDENSYDSEDFMGKWPLPKCAVKWAMRANPTIYSLNYDFPLPLRQAMNSYLKYGNLNILINTLAFMSELVHEHRDTIQFEYYRWLGRARIYTPRIKQVALLMKPFLKSIPAEDQLFWHLLPFLRDIDAHPEDFWPADLLPEGIQFVKRQLGCISLGEDEILEALARGEISSDAYLHCLALQRDWKRLKTTTMAHGSKVRFPKTTNAFIANLLARNSPSCHSYPKMVATIAFSANYNLLEALLTICTPAEILLMSATPHIRNRITLMMHLSPEVESYHGKNLVNKNSIFFRNWVMLHFTADEGQKIADLKLLHYYFMCRIGGQYPYYDIFNRDETGNHMILGLLNEPGSEPRGRSNTFWDLSFAPI